ncbi:M15 family metallopeptidase [Tissierella sp.]|uniref:M15 family metallopeptidase n=1 Tax=Tissierella sp. TaxID=41274 RepID=UPI00285D16A6|nr:M15 family metallopeptidase [Tissierella sp.]MDR7855386.1 M15 family metallopeptidase [Tissierella sp.]
MKENNIQYVKLSNGKIIRQIEGLVLLTDLDDSFIIDLKYATADNFFEKCFYPVKVCAIRRETGEKLVKANNIFKEKGYSIKVWDAYRPLNIQRAFYEAYPNTPFVAKPPDKPITSGFRPRHNNGMAVDITLVDKDGKELEMPSEFDDFTEKASPTYEHMTLEARKNVNFLMEVMLGLGFEIHQGEWWHFVDSIETPNPYLDIALEEFL